MALNRILLYQSQAAVRSGLRLNSLQLRPATRLASSIADSMPRVAQPSLWQSLIPKPFRSSSNGSEPKKVVRKEGWNPATFYIVIFLLIGSNAINLIALKNDSVQSKRHADQQIAKLREVIELVRQGKDVDVEAMLGTGDKEREEEWEEILKEIEQSAPDYIAERKQRLDRLKGFKTKDDDNNNDKNNDDPEGGETQPQASPEPDAKEVPWRPVRFY